ncbi:hypothetical protein WJX72_010774 [[Myrmecia] bisecta]|uniref:U6 small nuclear RNA (adenine-(43)-N(6))-methyltransferase n=1 Tax=[Myrmecia] bisecta TaxID=41462 RepID=A0AAW1PB45_9CHLO
MHPRNRYADAEPDFAALSQQYPSLQPYVAVHANGSGSIDFTDLQASRELTRVLLLHDFGIDWAIPPGQLIPPVTNRANYIHWLEDLLQLSSPAGQARVLGLDIGCGANLIYPLLGAAINGWCFVGVDVTDVAIDWAQRNVNANPHLARLIHIRKLPHTSGLNAGVLLPAVQEGETFAFCMCNPPFFESMEEAGQNPSTAFSGTADEMVCPGGELAFVSQMVHDSVQLGKRVHWYTSMVGKKATLKALRKLLHSCHVTALRTTEFFQGRTSRWALAWSFAVDPNLASKPLPRAQPKQQTQSESARRELSVPLGVLPKAVVPKLLPALEAVSERKQQRRGSAAGAVGYASAVYHPSQS